MDFMDDGGFNEGNVDPNNGNGGGWGPLGFSDQGVWATEDEYRNWNAGHETPPNSSHDGRQSLSRSGNEPPCKKSRSSQGGEESVLVSSGSKAIGKMFYKTKMCSKFRAGVCPYITNCNFAHTLEELRKPPPNWQEIVASHEGERSSALTVEPREEHQIPTIDSPDSRLESQRSFKGRHCKKFYTEEGCPYGESCTFLHDEQSRTRESVAISVTPTVGAGFPNTVNGQTLKPSNWKTRICNKWETTGYCPFGNKCHFAHGATELHNYGGGLAETEGEDSVAATPDAKQGRGLAKPTDTAAPLTLSFPHTDVYHMSSGIPVQRSGGVAQRPGQRALQKWKGPDRISKIYGDWIDDLK
ncbi:hypothetical protein Leryth_003999 [Lithospermum erythrorhizon]|nr:hypothetical protein Leryth_003999 [Lithospermum erythrorhizon]